MVSFHALKVFASRPRKGRGAAGSLIPLWNVHEGRGLVPRFVYATTCLPGKVKGPYRHARRRGLLSILRGRVAFVYRVGGRFRERVLVSKRPVMVDIPPRQDYCIVGLGREEALLVNVCDYAWRKGDGEASVPDFRGYNFAKWSVK
jgi:hypothetical protein